MTLTKKDLKNQSSSVIESFLETIKSSLESDEDVMISGFGKFSVKKKSERRGRNPSTGEEVMIEPRKVVTFSCSGKLRERMNGKNQVWV